MARIIRVRRIKIIRRGMGALTPQPLNRAVGVVAAAVRPVQSTPTSFVSGVRPVAPADQWARTAITSRNPFPAATMGRVARIVGGVASGRQGTPVFIFGGPQFVSEVKRALGESKSIAFTGSASDLVHASPLAPLAKSQVAIVDANIGGAIDGARAARAIQRSFPNCSQVIVVRTMSEEAVVWLRKLHNQGDIQWSIVNGKGMTRAGEFESAIQSASRGLRWVQPELKPVLERVKVEAASAAIEEKAKTAAQGEPAHASTAAPERSNGGFQLVGVGRPSRPVNVGSAVSNAGVLNSGAVPVNANTKVEW